MNVSILAIAPLVVATACRHDITQQHFLCYI